MQWRVAESVLRPEMSVKHRILTGLMPQGLSVHRAKKKSNENGAIRAMSQKAFICVLLLFFVYSFTVIQRESYN